MNASHSSPRRGRRGRRSHLRSGRDQRGTLHRRASAEPQEALAPAAPSMMCQLLAQVICPAFCAAVLRGLPDSFWLRPRPEDPLGEAWLWIPALAAVITTTIALLMSWQAKLQARHLVAHLFGAYCAFALGRWSTIDARAVLLAATGFVALVPGLVVAQQWKATVSLPLARALQTWCAVLAVGFTVLWTVAVSETRAQILGVALAMALTLNPVTQGVVAAVCGALPRWLEGRLRLGVLSWCCLGALPLWAVWPFVKDNSTSPLRQFAYNMALTGSVSGLALILSDRVDKVLWWRRALVPAALTVGGFLILEERGSLAVLFVTSIPLVALDRGRGREPLLLIGLALLLGSALVMCIPVVQERWLDFARARPLTELDRARTVVPLSGLIGWAGAARPNFAAWVGRDYAITATCLNAGLIVGALTSLSIIVALYHASEALLQVNDYALRLVGIALSLLWGSSVIVALSWLGGLPFVGVPLAGVARGIWAVVFVNVALAVLAGAITASRSAES